MKNTLFMLAVVVQLGCGEGASSQPLPPVPTDVETCKSLSTYTSYDELDEVVSKMKPCDACIKKNGDASKCGGVVVTLGGCLQNISAATFTRIDYRVIPNVVTKRIFTPDFQYGELTKNSQIQCSVGSLPNGCSAVVPASFYCSK